MTFAMQRDADGRDRGFILPLENADEAALASGAQVYPAATLMQVCAHFCAARPEERLIRHRPEPRATLAAFPDFSEVKGQKLTKRAGGGRGRRPQRC
ncbi:hypothetical protein LP419_13625 [Massilia sp. H-1]|nr:hypothetical protein LP419_13625 [Massilia sp. H-1]